MERKLIILLILVLASSAAYAANIQDYNNTTVTSNGQIAVLQGYVLSDLLDTAEVMNEGGWTYMGQVLTRGRYGSTYMLTMAAPEGGSHARGGR